MDELNVYPVTRVKDELSSFVRRAEAGESIRIGVNGRPAARLVADQQSAASAGQWTLVSDSVSGYLPYPFFPPEVQESRSGNGSPDIHMNERIESPGEAFRPGLAALLSAWEPSPEKGRERAILWTHLITGAAVIAVPRGDYRGQGEFAYFHTLGLDCPITCLRAWTNFELEWSTGDATAYIAAHRRAVEKGSNNLGLA